MPSRVMNTEPIFQPPKIVLSHQSFKDVVGRQNAKPLTESRPAPKPLELLRVGEAPRIELVHAEEVAELGMFPIENRSRFADGVLPPGKRVDVHAVIVPRDRFGVVMNLQSASIEPVRQ